MADWWKKDKREGMEELWTVRKSKRKNEEVEV
jgi:hypothetical protein